MKTVTTTRIVLDKEERAIAQTWGCDWARIRSDIKKFGRAAILTGEWSGYNPGQRRICHTEYSRNDHSRGMALKSIIFTDGTTLKVEIRAYTLEQILGLKMRRINSYQELIREARGAMVENFHVGMVNEPEHSFVGFDTPEQASRMEISKDRIRKEREGDNWYDKF